MGRISAVGERRAATADCRTGTWLLLVCPEPLTRDVTATARIVWGGASSGSNPLLTIRVTTDRLG
jgi:hypothetical protein